MAFFRVHYSAGMCGTDAVELVEADSDDAAIDATLDNAWDWFWQFNQEEDYAGYDPELDIWAEEISEEEYNDCVS